MNGSWSDRQMMTEIVSNSFSYKCYTCHCYCCRIFRKEQDVTDINWLIALFPWPQGDERRCAQVAVESIITWGEAAGVADLPQDIAKALAADVTYRLRQTLSVNLNLDC